MEDIKFDLNQIDKTFAKYKKNEIFEGVVISKNENGALFNIGGKKETFINIEEFEDYTAVKIGDRFKVVMLGTKNEDNLALVSKKMADKIIAGSLIAEKLKLGSTLDFTPTVYRDDSLMSKIGMYNVIVPKDEIDSSFRNFHFYLNKTFKAIVTEIDSEKKTIICSIKILKDQIDKTNQENFWPKVFINKIVKGTVEKILPYGAFVNVDGITCFIHISDIAYLKIDDINEYLKVGSTYDFRIIKLDRENCKVSLGIKQLTENPKEKALKCLKVGEILNGKVSKILAFGAIINIDNLNIDGLLHISKATDDRTKHINDIVKMGESVEVEVLEIDLEKQKVSFKLNNF